jgi:hypothetical protein
VQTANGCQLTLAQTTLADLDIVGGTVNSMCDQTERSKQDLYLLVCHPNAGITLYNAYHKEESITDIGLKIDDPSIDKIAKGRTKELKELFQPYRVYYEISR